MQYSALIGKPTGHSVSHLMYEQLALASGFAQPYRHIKVDVEPSDLQLTLNAFQTLGFVGINVTLPYKLEVMPWLDDLDESATVAGAVNTVKFKAGRTIGFNTDWTGIYRPLHEWLATRQRKTLTVTIFGSGGAARAAIYAAQKLEATKIYVVHQLDSGSSATRDLAERHNEFGITMVGYTSLAMVVDAADIVINTTPAGMAGYDAETPFDPTLLDNLKLSGKVYFDAVFNPVRTPLLQYFESKGADVIDGLWMMIYQGVHALAIWTDQVVSLTDQQANELHNMLQEEIAHV